jgi:hypothetical protein
VRTDVEIVRGPLRGRRGWISGNLEDRARRGITRAIVHAGADVELLSIENLQAVDQLDLFANKNAAGATAGGVDELIRIG